MHPCFFRVRCFCHHGKFNVFVQGHKLVKKIVPGDTCHRLEFFVGFFQRIFNFSSFSILPPQVIICKFEFLYRNLQFFVHRIEPLMGFERTHRILLYRKS